MRLPSFFSKKRGERRTGLPAWGSLGEAIYYLVLLTAGLVIGGLMLTGVAVSEWRINNQFVEASGRLIGKGLARHTTTDIFGNRRQSWRPAILVEYQARGKLVRSWSSGGLAETSSQRETAIAQLAQWQLNRPVSCWYDPDNVTTVVLKRGYNWWLWLLTLLLPGALVAFGSSGLLHAAGGWGRSEERQAAEVWGLLKRLTRGMPEASGFPAIPACDNLVNSPGTVLRFRLPTESPEAWTLLGSGLFAGLWNAVVIVLAIGAGFDVAGGRADWWLLLLLAPFTLVGLLAIGLFFRRLLRVTAIGPSHLEISDHPLRPGGSYEVLLSQAGSVAFRRLELRLELEEQATFRQGTDVRTERQVVCSEVIRCWNRVEPLPGTPFEAELQFRVPPRAMHSFHSTHNTLSWQLVLCGQPDHWPELKRVFPLVIYPSDTTAAMGAAPVSWHSGQGAAS